jgi:predicted dehydrogenase
VGQGIDPARMTDDFRTALPRVDAVDIVTPADSHRTVAEASLAAGRHCFVEKPLTVSVADGRAVAAAAVAASRVVQVGHIFRFHPVTAALGAALTAGRIGRVRYATGRFAGLKRPRTDVGVTQTDAIHYFDLFAYLLGREATRVSAVQRDYLGRGLDDMSVTTVAYDDVPLTVEANYFAPGVQRECVIVGERGALVADFGSSTVALHIGEHRRRHGAWEAVDEGKEELAATGPEPLRLELEAFLAACRSHGPSPVSAEAGVHALEIVEAAARAARLERTVSIAEIR